jgi:hypothetical protein
MHVRPQAELLYYRVITKAKEELVYTYYSALNFRDVMTATGKLSLYGIISDRLNQVRKKDICVLTFTSNNMYEQCWSLPDLPLILELLILIMRTTNNQLN